MGPVLVYLVRHAKAEGSHPSGDEFRALSAEGRARIAALGPLAREKDFRADLALSSPFLRAVQTRDLFAPFLSPRVSETTKALSPESHPQDVLDELERRVAEGYRRIAVFTHNPLVTQLAAWLSVPGTDPVFHTPTILALEFLELRPGAGRPLWTLSP